MSITNSLSTAVKAIAGANSATMTRTAGCPVAEVNRSTGYWLARAGLCLVFIYSGVSKLLDLQSAIAEQAHVGLPHPAWFAAATIFTQLTGSALIMLARGFPAAVGAVLLAGFTLIATLLGHAFWHETGVHRFADLNSFL